MEIPAITSSTTLLVGLVLNWLGFAGGTYVGKE